MQLKLAEDLALPIDTVTQSLAIVAKRRAGKSYTARRLAEQLFKAGQQVVIADPKGDWWGIRSAADGKRPGLPIVILGGEHGDVPLEPHAGELVAQLVVEERVSVLLDLSLPRKHEVVTFMTAFLETLYRLKARERYRTPMMLIIDEADAIAPQKPAANEARMLGAAEDIVRRGGQRGMGCTLVTQRSAVLNKNVLTQTQVMVALRTIAPQDLHAMSAWIEVHGTLEEKRRLMEALPALPVGTACFWSPGWPTAAGIFKCVQVLPIETYDSGATPRPGEKRIEPKSLADVDLEALRRQMAATLERAAAADPKKLQARIRELEHQVKQLEARPPEATVERVEFPILDPSIASRLEQVCHALADHGRQVEGLAADIGASIHNAHQLARQPSPALAPRAAPVSRPLAGRRGERGAGAVSVHERPAAAEGAAVSAPQQRILDALAWLESVRVPVAAKIQLAMLAGQRPTSSGYTNNLGSLRTAGLIEYPSPGYVMLTAAGRGAARAPETPPTTEALHAALYARLSAPQSRILRALIGSYPKDLGKEELAVAAEQSLTSSGYTNNLGSLRSLGLIDYPKPGRVVALPVLFLD